MSYWNDKISNKHFEQATAANQPTHGLRTYNGLPVVDFDGTDNTATTDYMKSINTVTEPRGSHSSFWIVAYVDTVTSTNDSIFSLVDSTNTMQFSAGNAANFYAYLNCDSAYGTSTYFSNNSNLEATPMVIGFLGSNTINVRINGKSKGNLSATRVMLTVSWSSVQTGDIMLASMDGLEKSSRPVTTLTGAGLKRSSVTCLENGESIPP